jgi:hypothetical protein
MTQEFKTIDDILDSKEFNEMFDFEAEQKEIEEAGWTLKELRDFGLQLAKSIKKRKK